MPHLFEQLPQQLIEPALFQLLPQGSEQSVRVEQHRNVDIDAIHDHMSLIKQQNDHIAKLDAKIAEHELENEKFKFARSMLYSGRRLGIKDGIGFQKGDNVKLNAPPKRLSNFIKGKAPMPQDNEGYSLYPAGYPEHKIRRIHSRKSHSGPNHAFMYKSETSIGNPLMLNCLRRKLLLHQMNLAFHLELLMHPMF